MSSLTCASHLWTTVNNPRSHRSRFHHLFFFIDFIFHLAYLILLDKVMRFDTNFRGRIWKVSGAPHPDPVGGLFQSDGHVVPVQGQQVYEETLLGGWKCNSYLLQRCRNVFYTHRAKTSDLKSAFGAVETCSEDLH